MRRFRSTGRFWSPHIPAFRPGGRHAAGRNCRKCGAITEGGCAAPAKYEPFGLASLEAALSRCARVLGDIATLRELWDGAAVFVSPDDPQQLAAALRTLQDDEAKCAEFGSKAWMRAQHYSLER